VLRQRNALLKQVGGHLDDAAEVTLGVWDAKAAASGSRLAELREGLVTRLGPAVQQAYRDLSGGGDLVEVGYRRSWAGPLDEALASGRRDDLRRGLTLVGPHRDELVLALNGLPARTHASQGEQRCLSLALRLAGHRELAAELGAPPILLLDDVFSELDRDRSAALLDALPMGQAFLSTAGALPEGARPDAVFEVGAGTLERSP
jgi:DNA replication and repair protein RecF